MLNINKLYETQRKKEEMRLKTYDTIKKILYNKIDLVSKTGKFSCWYQVPTIILGHPPINMEECCAYIQLELDKEILHYEFYTPNLFYVNWELHNLKTPN